jgi:hypothetical protein
LKKLSDEQKKLSDKPEKSSDLSFFIKNVNFK